ncbi:MAG: hypothetical protein MJ252_25795 [archaeon]|nr:hypothetical protein [archaeon]
MTEPNINTNAEIQRYINRLSNGNDYNYPPLQREDTMSRKCLCSDDFPIRKFKSLDTNRGYSLNNYNLDIKGSSPRNIGFYSEKPDFTTTNEDIEKSSPKELFLPNNKPNYNISNRDIEGTIPIGHRSTIKTNRHLNPLNPCYSLPSSGLKEMPYEERKFLRNTLDISDIEGAKPKKSLKCPPRDNINKVPKEITYFRNKKYIITEAKDYKDVYGKKFFSKRHTDPIDPEYTLDYGDGEIYRYGKIEGNKPETFKKVNEDRRGGYNYLSNRDIIYSQPHSVSFLQKYYIENKKPFKYSPEDIEGSHTGSLVTGIKTKRNINPLDPDYQFIGRSMDVEELRKNKKELNLKEENNLKENIPKSPSPEVVNQPTQPNLEQKNLPIVTEPSMNDFKGIPFKEDK